MGYDDDECRGALDNCKGCSCIEEVSDTTFRVARKARGNILPGDLVKVTGGFTYQKGGKRLGYFGSEGTVARGPGNPHLAGLGWPTAPLRTRKGFQVIPAPALPPEAVEREALATKVKALREASPATVAEAEARVETARALEGAIEAYLAGVPAEAAPAVRSYLERGYHTTFYSPKPMSLTATAEASLARARSKAVKDAWEATGLAWREAGDVVTGPDGRKYRLGAQWSKWVASSNIEYMGESVDGEVVSGRSLLDPDTGAVLMRWKRGEALPRQAA